MGFAESDAVDALLQNASVPEAAEYLVNMMERNTRTQQIQQSLTTLQQSTTTTPAVEGSTNSLDGQQGSNPANAENEQESRPYTDLKPLNRNDLQVEYNL